MSNCELIDVRRFIQNIGNNLTQYRSTRYPDREIWASKPLSRECDVSQFGYGTVPGGRHLVWIGSDDGGGVITTVVADHFGLHYRPMVQVPEQLELVDE